MKNIIIILAASVIASSVSAQSTNRTLNISFNKTTSLVFKEAVISVDRGSRDVLAKKVEGATNAIHVKAGKKGFEETNLTVLTSDGQFHHFTVHFSEAPEQFIYHIDSHQSETNAEVVLDETINLHLMKQLAQKALLLERNSKVSGKKKYRMTAVVKSIFVHEGLMLMHVQIENRSSIAYDIQSLRFFIRDTKTVKRTAAQEAELSPLFCSEDDFRIEGESKYNAVFAFKKFTIPDAKQLHIELTEKDGGRNFLLNVSNGPVINARKL